MSIQHSEKNRVRWRQRHSSGSELANTGLVSAFAETLTSTTNDTQVASGSGRVAIQARPTPSGQQTETYGLLLIRGALTERGLSCQAIDLSLASWQSSTQKQYLTYIHKWVNFCNIANLDIFTTEVTYILEFLTGLFNDGIGYSAINTARSALSTFLGITVAEYIGTNACHEIHDRCDT